MLNEKEEPQNFPIAQEQSFPTVELKESIEMELTAKGLYKWTIKVREEKVSEETIVRMKKIHDKAILDFSRNVFSIGENK
jgi:hypothetical protein